MDRSAAVAPSRDLTSSADRDRGTGRPAMDGHALLDAHHDASVVDPFAAGRGGEARGPHLPMGGTGEEVGPAPAPAKPADAKPAVKPSMTQSAVGITVKQRAKALSKRGAAEYKVQWSVGGKKNGWVIQHLTFAPAIKDKDDKDVVANNTPVEYWEGWQVRDGSVYIGSSDQAHQSDTFRTVSEKADTKGTILETGKVSFVEGYALAKPPWGNAVPEAGSLPTMKVAPDGWSDGKAQDHTMTVTYDDIAKTDQDQVGNP